jgi:hypothetical protein
LATDCGIARQSTLLVVDDRFDAGQTCYQFRLTPADDPGQPSFGALTLNGLHRRDGITDVTDRGQAQHADVAGFC